MDLFRSCQARRHIFYHILIHTRYNSTDTGSERILYLQRTTVPYPASPVEPLEALTHRSQHGAPLRYSN